MQKGHAEAQIAPPLEKLTEATTQITAPENSERYRTDSGRGEFASPRDDVKVHPDHVNPAVIDERCRVLGDRQALEDHGLGSIQLDQGVLPALSCSMKSTNHRTNCSSGMPVAGSATSFFMATLCFIAGLKVGRC